MKHSHPVFRKDRVVGGQREKHAKICKSYIGLTHWDMYVLALVRCVEHFHLTAWWLYFEPMFGCLNRNPKEVFSNETPKGRKESKGFEVHLKGHPLPSPNTPRKCADFPLHPIPSSIRHYINPFKSYPKKNFPIWLHHSSDLTISSPHQVATPMDTEPTVEGPLTLISRKPRMYLQTPGQTLLGWVAT